MSERLPIEITGTLDLESWRWTNFAIGAVYDGITLRHWWAEGADLEALKDGDLPSSIADHPSPPGARSGETGGLDGMIDYLRGRPGVFWAHAGGVFDFMAILERCRARGIPCQVDRSQQRVTRIVMGRTELRDSYSIWSVPLDEICGALRRKVPSLPWPCTCGRKCAGYCRIGEAARRGDPDLLAYIEADCRDLYDGLHKLRSFATTNGIRLRGTLAQTSWVHAKAEMGVPDSTMTWDVWRAARKADKGGRQCVARPRVARELVRHHDICNAYPAQLAKLDLPCGRMSQYANRQADMCLNRARPGLYTLSVTVPADSFVPPLPWAHGGQLYFPTGKVTGTWCLPELVAALERGVTIDRVHSAMVWEAAAPIFAELVAKWYAIRKAAGRKTPLGQWTGRLAKAFTGKLAERPERQRAVLHPEAIKVCLRTGQCRNGCTKRCGAYEQLDLDGKIWGVPYQKLGGSAYPEWSAYLRASTRVQWLAQAESYGRDLVMGHTDSLWTTGRRQPTPLGDDLGQWEYQDVWTDMDIRSATVYAGRRLPDDVKFSVDYGPALPVGEFETVPGEFVVRGIPWASETDWKRGAGLIDRGVLTFGRATKSTKGLWRKRVRRWTLPGGADNETRAHYGDRELASDGRTYPMDAGKIRELVAQARRRNRRRL